MTGKKKILSIILAFVIAIFYVVPVQSFAYETEEQTEEATEIQTTEATEAQADESGNVQTEEDTGKSIEELVIAHDARGKEVDISSLDEDAYDGYVFKLNKQGKKSVSSGTIEKKSGGEIEYSDMSGVFVADSLDAIDEAVDAEKIDYIEPNYTYEATGSTEEYSPSPNDKYYAEQWNLSMMNVEEAWSLGLFGQSSKYSNKEKVTVAVVDSGLIGTGEGSTAGHEDIDYSHVREGVNLANTKKGTPDETGHGTFVSGMIFAENNNGLGISGIMPETDIVPVKVFGSASSTPMSTVTDGIYAAIEAKADVINLSLGSEYASETIKAACEAAVSRGILVVASAGNDGSSVKNYPAAYDCVVGVASVDSTGEPSYFSQYGESVFVTAPGGSVRSLSHSQTDGYRTGSGTSFSCPEVVALGAMTKSVMPETNQYDFMEMLKVTSMDKGSEGYDDYYGYGLVDFGSAAKYVMGRVYEPVYNIYFNVEDEKGGKINDAEIAVTAAEDISWDDDAEAGIRAGKWAEGYSVKAEPDGSFKLHKGKYRYSIKRNGYLTVKGEFTTLSKEQNIDKTLEQTFDTAFNIQDTDGDIIDDAGLELVRKKDNLAISISQDGNGDYKEKLPKGTYSCTVNADGYNSYKGTLNVDGTRDTEDIVLYLKAETSTVTFSFREKTEDGTGSEIALDSVTLKVLDRNGNEITPSGDNVYELVKGHTYIYKASGSGYESEGRKFKVENTESMDVSISLKQIICSIEFKITDKDKVLLGDAELQILDENNNEMMPEKGEAFRYNLPQGKYSYRIDCNGFNTKRGMLTAKKQHQEFAVKLTGREYELKVKCVNKEGNEIENADISLWDEENSLKRPASDGEYLLAAGDYRIGAFAEGYEYAEIEKSIENGDDAIELLMTERDLPADSYSGGNGTKNNPYLIADEKDLRTLAEKTVLVYADDSDAKTNRKDTIDGYYMLVRDIMLTDPLEPVGNFESSDNYAIFGGSFEGAGHSISGLTVNRKNTTGNGLFGAVKGGEIANLTVRGDINSGSYTGGIAGVIFYDSQPTKITGCEYDGSVRGTSYVGGIVGAVSAETSAKVNCYISSSCHKGGQVRATNPAGITANTENNKVAGGIIGEGRASEITDCYNQGDVSSEYVVGGIAGRLQKNTYVYDVYNTGSIKEYGTDTSRKFRGGVVGDLYGNIDTGFYLKPTEVNSAIGSIQAEGSAVNTEGRYAQSLKANAATVNELNLRKESITNSFCLTDEYPVLSWQKTPDKNVYASKPEIIDSSGNAEYTVGTDKADAITLTLSMKEGENLSYQWYENDVESIGFADEIEGVGGRVSADGKISYIPDISETGSRYYFAKVTNTVGENDTLTKSSVYTNIVKITVKSDVTAATPTIDSVSLRLKGTEAELGSDVECYTEENKQYEAVARCSIADSGELSYQWYVSEYANTKGSPVSNGNSNILSVDTSEDGTRYYYVAVRNTLKGNNGESVSDRVKSPRIKVTVIDRKKRESEEAAGRKNATPGTVTGLKLKRVSFNTFELSWDGTANVEEYRIYRIRNGESKYTRVASVTDGTSYKDTSLYVGYTYTYKVRAANTYSYKYSDKSEILYGPYSSAKSAKAYLSSTGITLKAGVKSAAVSWKKVDGATGYKIYRSTRKTKGYKCIKTIKPGTVTKYTNKKLKKNKRYYYKIRAYRMVGKKIVYSSYSAVKSVKAK